jgi:outer membrane scaffolding protein for murein synthesis (MipA/OmpV family)
MIDIRLALLVAALLAAVPAGAQTANRPLPDPNDRSDYLRIGIGAALVPDYEGSDDHRVIPGAVLQARVNGVAIFSRGTYLYADLIGGSGNVNLDAGPIAGVRLNRTGKVKNDRVDALPELDTAIEVGGFAGVTFNGLTNPYDALSLRLDAVKDIGGAHESWVMTPAIEFGTPLSRTTYVGVSASADFVSDRHNDYYFGISPAGALASGLPAYNPGGGGLKSWQVGALTGLSLSGDLRKGLGLFGSASYKRLTGEAADSPIVRGVGSRSQWLLAAGVGYSW